MRRRLLLGLPLVSVGAFLAYAFLSPSPIDPVAWDAPPRPALEGSLAPNTALRAAQVGGAGLYGGPETLAVDGLGRIYSGNMDGSILRTKGPGVNDPLEVFAQTGGRPLGLEFDSAGSLLVADIDKGLLSITPEGVISVLATEAEGVPFKFADDIDLDVMGRIYFTDASDRFGKRDYLLDLFEGRPHGRLLRYDPETRRTEVLLKALNFANGVALSATGDFVLVNETWRYRIVRLWLAGPKAGTRDVFADGLPGFPDGLSRGEDGRFYVALYTVRNAASDLVAPRPWMRTLLVHLPRALWPKPARYGFVLALDADGHPVQTWQDPDGEVLYEVTSVRMTQGRLYLGSLHDDRIGVLPLDGR